MVDHRGSIRESISPALVVGLLLWAGCSGGTSTSARDVVATAPEASSETDEPGRDVDEGADTSSRSDAPTSVGGDAGDAFDDVGGPPDVRRADIGRETTAPPCGDGTCALDEDCASCPDDCGCAAGEDCVDQQCVSLCPDGCSPLGATICSANDSGYRVCLPDAERPLCGEPSLRVPCAAGRTCAAEGCSGPCLRPRVMILVDRSSSMEGERWAYTIQGLQRVARTLKGHVAFGLRLFPAPLTPCEAGESVPLRDHDLDELFEGLTPPDPQAQTPIASALADLSNAFGDPDEGEAVVLITDGDETCGQEQVALEAVAGLRRRGVRTFAVAVTNEANEELLRRVAELGGTGTEDGGPGPRIVSDEDGLVEAILGSLASLDSCLCTPADPAFCQAGEVRRCSDDGRVLVATGESCESGFSGVRRDLPVADVAFMGFVECWGGPYSGGGPLDELMSTCDQDVLLLACGRWDAELLTVAAMGRREEVLLETGGNGYDAHVHNSVAWYLTRGASMGFLSAGLPLQRSTCDVSSVWPEPRLCWHTAGDEISGGYRCGDQLWLNDSEEWVRRVYQRAGPLDAPCADDPSCRACPAEQQSCLSPSTSAMCGVDGSARLDTAEDCGERGCDRGSGDCFLCVPNERFCNRGSSALCNDEGTGPTGMAQFCANGCNPATGLCNF